MTGAIILTDGQLGKSYGKTAHGLITGKSRYPIYAVIDRQHSGMDAGFVTDKKTRNIPVFGSVSEAMSMLDSTPTHCIIGVATPGGAITSSLQGELALAIEHKLTIVNGLHQLVSEHPVLKPLADQHEVQILDIRKPKPIHALHPWKGSIARIKTPRIAVLGTDCAIGKRTTCHLIWQMCQESDIRSEMIYTGQTGWLQGFKYGLILDSTLNDFVSGELEYAIVSCAEETAPELILVEGQSSLRNPSGPCGAELICSGGAKGVILQHAIGREYFNHGEGLYYPLPSLQDEIKLINWYGAEVLAVTLNTRDLKNESWQAAKQRVSQEIELPVIMPREEGVSELLPIIKTYIAKQTVGCQKNENQSN
ncbi:MAG: DUF1611 domain-containing protein [Gammaproteobacteria bacterium]